MLNGLDLFSGIGGISEALSPWVRTVAYCENDRYAQAVLLSRMSRGEIHTAPIWDDVTTLKAEYLPKIDIISGGFPCQDISIAGAGKGLEGERSGLFGEIIRLSSELRPRFILLENVPAITFRGLSTVTREISKLRYDCRWGLLSANDVGAPHRRERWWLLGYSKHDGPSSSEGRGSSRKESSQGSRGREHKGEVGKFAGTSDESINVAHSNDPRSGAPKHEDKSGREKGADKGQDDTQHRSCRCSQVMADSEHERRERRIYRGENQERKDKQGHSRCSSSGRAGQTYSWAAEPDLDRVVNGLPLRGNRLMRLGNAVVPQCAREAFIRLIEGT